MATIDMKDGAGKAAGKAELAPTVFDIEPNMHVMHQVVRAQRASWRQGTANTRTRGMVRGGGRKPWRQKGTGRARQGSTRAPQWRGGGTVFGPTPRSYSYKLNKKVRRLALKSVLSEKVAESNMTVVDAFNIAEPKTKTFVQIISNINACNKTLFVVAPDEDFENAFCSMRNIPTMMMLTADGINVYDIVNANKIVFTEAAVKHVEEALG